MYVRDLQMRNARVRVGQHFAFLHFEVQKVVDLFPEFPHGVAKRLFELARRVAVQRRQVAPQLQLLLDLHLGPRERERERERERGHKRRLTRLALALPLGCVLCSLGCVLCSLAQSSCSSGCAVFWLKVVRLVRDMRVRSVMRVRESRGRRIIRIFRVRESSVVSCWVICVI